MNRDEAVKAAAEAVCARWHGSQPCSGCVVNAAAAVEAVWPVIERAVRAEAAAEIRAARPVHLANNSAAGSAWDAAARIVEGP